MDFYNELADSYDALYREEQFRKYDFVKDFFEGCIIDIGCGSGLLLQYLELHQLLRNIDCYIGIDNSPSLLKLAKKKIPKTHNNLKIKFILSDAEYLDYNTLDICDMFDVTLSFTAIHHFTNLNFLLTIKSNLFIISVLKKSKRYNEIVNFIKDNFYIKKVFNDFHDDIFILNLKK